MKIKIVMNNKQSKIYLFPLFVFCLAFLLIAFFFPSFMQAKFILSGIIFLILTAFCFLRIDWIVVAIVVLLPALGGLEPYQIDISPLLQIVGINQVYQIDFFLLTRIFILFIAILETLRKGASIIKTPMFFALLLSVTLNIIPFLNSQYKIFGLAYYWFFLVSAFGSYFLGYFILGNKKGYLKIIMAILFSAVIPIIVGVKQIIFGEFFVSNDTTLPRLQTVFDHPNKFGSFLFVVLTIYLICYLSIRIKKNKQTEKAITLVPFFILGIFFLGTFSRTSWIAFALAVIIIAIPRKEIRFPAIYLGSLFVFLSLFVESMRNRILGIFSRQYNDTLSGRMETWNMALFEFKKSPWIGYGPGSFKEIIKNVQGTDVGNFYPHSDSIMFLLEGGVMGILSYLLYIVSALYYSFISFWKYPKGIETVNFLGRELAVDFKLLGFIPFVLFLVMVPYSLAEAPVLDYIYQVYAWILLGSWLGLNSSKLKIKS